MNNDGIGGKRVNVSGVEVSSLKLDSTSSWVVMHANDKVLGLLAGLSDSMADVKVQRQFGVVWISRNNYDLPVPESVWSTG